MSECKWCRSNQCENNTHTSACNEITKLRAELGAAIAELAELRAIKKAAAAWRDADYDAAEDYESFAAQQINQILSGRGPK